MLFPRQHTQEPVVIFMLSQMPHGVKGFWQVLLVACLFFVLLFFRKRLSGLKLYPFSATLWFCFFMSAAKKFQRSSCLLYK